jgi:ABC-2 type transport system permease protein
VIKVSKSGESVERGQTIGVAIGLVVLLYTSLLIYGIITMRSVLEETFPAIHVPVSVLIWVVFFFFGGYFLYSAMFAAIGAACSTEQDAVQLQWIAMGPLVFTMMIYWSVLSDPSSTASIVFSEIPFLAPVLMPLRISIQTPPFWQEALSVVLLLLTTLGVIYASAKVYRVGVLMYGKRPTIPELVRWLRYS